MGRYPNIQKGLSYIIPAALAELAGMLYLSVTENTEAPMLLTLLAFILLFAGTILETTGALSAEKDISKHFTQAKLITVLGIFSTGLALFFFVIPQTEFKWLSGALNRISPIWYALIELEILLGCKSVSPEEKRSRVNTAIMLIIILTVVEIFLRNILTLDFISDENAAAKTSSGITIAVACMEAARAAIYIISVLLTKSLLKKSTDSQAV